MTEQIPLEQVQFPGGEGKVVHKRGCPALESPLGTGLQGPGETHLEME